MAALEAMHLREGDMQRIEERPESEDAQSTVIHGSSHLAKSPSSSMNVQSFEQTQKATDYSLDKNGLHASHDGQENN